VEEKGDVKIDGGDSRVEAGRSLRQVHLTQKRLEARLGAQRIEDGIAAVKAAQAPRSYAWRS
jgi:hypothetical protein